MKWKASFVFVSFGFLFLAALHQVTYAHIGGGPPFLQINNKYAQTNPYYQQEEITLNVPQDSPPESYFVNKPLQLAIDTNRLTQQTTIPPSMVKDLTFRWSVATGDNFDQVSENYQFGSQVTYTFKTPRSYLVIVEAKTPIDDQYIIIDTVQLNVLPSPTYHLPKVSVFIGTQDQGVDLLVSQTQVDPSAKPKTYLWDFNEGQLIKGKSVTHQFDAMSPYNTRMIYHRFVDARGFSTDVGFAGENYNDAIRFVPFGNMKNAPITIGSYNQALTFLGTKPQLSTQSRLTIIGIILFILFWLFLFFTKRHRQRNNC